MQEAILHAWDDAYRGRKEKKRNFRRLWNVRINAALREKELTYSKFVNILKQKNITLDRKILSELAATQPEIFSQIVETATAK